MISAESALERSLKNENRGQDMVRTYLDQQITQACSLGETHIEIPIQGLPVPVPVSTLVAGPGEQSVMIVLVTLGEKLKAEMEELGYHFSYDKDNIIIRWDISIGKIDNVVKFYD